VIGYVARKEFTEISRDGRFRWTAAIMILLLVTALATGWQRYSAFTAMQSKAQVTSNTQWLKQGDKNPHSAAHYGNYAFKPAGPLAYFDSGVEAYTGTAVFMEAHKQNFALARPASDQSAVARFGDLTGATILQVMLPLLIIFLGFKAFSGERESGTLRQLLSMGVKRNQILWGKAIGIGAAVALVVVPCILIGAIILSLTDLTAAVGFGTRTLVLSASYAAYGGIFLFLTLAVSAVAPSSRTALIALIGFWAFTAFIAPKAVTEISKVTHPTPAYGEFMADMRDMQARGFDGVSPWRRIQEMQQELYTEYGVSSVAELPVYWPATRMQRLEELDHEVFDFHYQSLRSAYTDQLRLQDTFGIIAPLLSLRSISMGMSGTDLVTHLKFMDAAEQYRRNMVAKMNGYLSKAAASLNDSFNSSNYMTADEGVFAIVPPFEFEQPALRQVLSDHTRNLIALSLWLAVVVTAARIAVDRLSLEVR
jgi:ABC-2 type transport system permease protein